MKKIYGLAILSLVAILCVWAFIAHRHNGKSDEFYMEMALQAAKANPNNPFAAVIVDNKTGEVLATGVDMTNENPVLHGDIVAINNCAKKYPHVNWKNTTLYTTAEPCAMCQSAVVWAGISKVVYGTSSEFLKMHGWKQIDINAADINGKASFYQGQLIGGVLHEKTDVVFSNSTLHPALQLASHP
jgi:tRNA(adenine34) deaminase